MKGLPKIFCRNLRTFVSHTDKAIPAESHIIERALHTLWTSNFELNDKMLYTIDKNFVAMPGVKKAESKSSLKQRIIEKIDGIIKN